jgi:hypothetical protein
MRSLVRPLFVPFFLLSAGAAQADLTADQVWQSWQDGATAAGLSLAADSTARDGASLRLAGVSVARAGGGQMNIAQIVLTEAGDGSVSAAFPDAVAMILSPENGEAGFSLVQEGLSVILREGAAPGGMVYDIRADRLDGTFTASDGDPAQSEQFVFNFSMGTKGLALTAETTSDDMARTAVKMSAATLNYDMTTASQILEMESAQTSTIADVSIALDMSVPASMPIMAMTGPGDVAKALRDGMTARMTFDQGVAEQTDATTDAFMSYDYAITTQPGTSVVTLDRSGMAIEGQVPGGAVAGTFGEMPEGMFTATFGAFDMAFKMPLIGNDGPDDFTFRMGFKDFALGDALWDLFDAGRVFPRDPATIAIDAGGKARLDLLGLAADDLAGNAPDPSRLPEIVSLDLRNIALSVAGASLTGQGAFAFATGADGVPVPDGRATFGLTGANALLDGAVAAGLATADDVGGLRMMMGMFMRPGTGEDNLTSEVEAKADGSLLVNGMRLK